MLSIDALQVGGHRAVTARGASRDAPVPPRRAHGRALGHNGPFRGSRGREGRGRTALGHARPCWLGPAYGPAASHYREQGGRAKAAPGSTHPMRT